MRQQTQVEEKIKIALAIYKGLPDDERADKLREWRTMPGHEARTLVALCERHEIFVRLERERTAQLQKEVVRLREQVSVIESRTAGQSDVYGSRTTDEIRRGTFGWLVVLSGAGAVCALCFEFGVGTVIGGAVAIGFLSLMFSGRGGNTETDYAPATRPTAQGQTQTIIFNVSQNGDVNYAQQ